MTMILDGSLGVTFNDASLQPAAASPYGLKNKIINGDMVISQRNGTSSVTPTNGAYTLDRWTFQVSQASKLTSQQNAGSVTPPVGFKNYLGITSSSAYSVISSDYFAVTQRIEGYNIADLGWGTANAKTVTLSFWVRSSLTGTFGGSLWNNAGDRSYPFTYTISSANTWEQKSITIAGDTSGTWLTTNETGISVNFSVGSGSSLSGTAGAWASALYTSATGATSVVGTNGATWYVTGVQLEIGSSATPFERRLYNQELANCQRYFQVLGKGLNGSPAYQIYSILTYEASATAWGTVPLKVTMRTQPTTVYSGTFTTSYGTQGPLLNDTNQSGPDNGVIGWAAGSGGTTGYSTYLRASNSTAAFISFSAEL
jgi:hypothetical protein